MVQRAAYRTIVRNAYITNTLREFFRRVFLFTTTFVPQDQIHLILDKHNPQTTAGWIPIINGDSINYLMTSHECTQRELMTSIYRFAISVPYVITEFILPRANAVDMLKACPLDYDYFKRKVTAILYQYNVLEDNMSDEQMVNLLNVLYLESKDDVSHCKQFQYMFTSPQGHNPVTTFSSSRVPIVDGQLRTGYVSIGDLVEPLSDKEKVGLNIPLGVPVEGYLPWITGNMLYGVGVNTMFHKYAANNNKSFATCASGSTQLMLECASLFGVDVRCVFLALFPWMDISDNARDHTIFEIVLAAQPHLPISLYKVFESPVEDHMEKDFIELIYRSIPPDLLPPLAQGAEHNAAVPMDGVIQAAQFRYPRVPPIIQGGKKKKGGADPSYRSYTLLQPPRLNDLASTKPIIPSASSSVNVMNKTLVAKSKGNLAKNAVKSQALGLTFERVQSKSRPVPVTQSLDVSCSEAFFAITPSDKALIKEINTAFGISISESDLQRIKAEKMPMEVASGKYLHANAKLNTGTKVNPSILGANVQKIMEEHKNKYVSQSRQERQLPDTDKIPKPQEAINNANSMMKNNTPIRGGKRK